MSEPTSLSKSQPKAKSKKISGFSKFIKKLDNMIPKGEGSYARVITFEEYKNLHAEDQIQLNQSCFRQDPLNNRYMSNILTGGITKTISIKNPTPMQANIAYQEDGKSFEVKTSTGRSMTLSSNDKDVFDKIQNLNLHVKNDLDISDDTFSTNESGTISNYNTIELKEYIYDPKIVYDIPLKYLKLRLHDLQTVLDTTIPDIGVLTNPTYARKIRLRKEVLEKLISLYHEDIMEITNQKADPEAKFYVASIQKNINKFRFLPVNLQYNKYQINNSDYGRITFGMATDHSGGYKKSLLKQAKEQLIKEYREYYQNNNTEHKKEFIIADGIEG